MMTETEFKKDSQRIPGLVSFENIYIYNSHSGVFVWVLGLREVTLSPIGMS